MNAPYVPTPVEIEKKNRIRLCVAAYAYDAGWPSPISDEEWDKLALKIRPEMSTGNEVMDKFFRDKFDPCTSMWIESHPNIKGLHTIYMRYFSHLHESVELDGLVREEDVVKPEAIKKGIVE